MKSITRVSVPGHGRPRGVAHRRLQAVHTPSHHTMARTGPETRVLPPELPCVTHIYKEASYWPSTFESQSQPLRSLTSRISLTKTTNTHSTMQGTWMLLAALAASAVATPAGLEGNDLPQILLLFALLSAYMLTMHLPERQSSCRVFQVFASPTVVGRNPAFIEPGECCCRGQVCTIRAGGITATAPLNQNFGGTFTITGFGGTGTGSLEANENLFTVGARGGC